MREQHLGVACVFVLGALSAAGLGGTTVGSTAELQAYYPNLATPGTSWGPTTVADPGVEFPDIYSSVWSADVGASSFRVDQYANGNVLGPADFNGFVLTLTGLTDPIAGVSIDASSTLVPSAFWATSNEIYLNYAGVGAVGESFTLVNIQFVPAPASAGVLAIGAACVRRRRS